MKRWNLDILYTSFEDPSLQKDIVKIESLIKELEVYVKDTLNTDISTKEKLLGYYMITDELSSMIEVIGNMGELTYAVDTSNTDALKLIEKVEGFAPAMQVNAVGFRKWLITVDNLESLLEQDEALKVYAFAILEEKQQAKHMLSDAEESLLAQMKKYWVKCLEQTTRCDYRKPYG